jgi:hypothetical protein
MALPYWQADTSHFPLIVVHLVGAGGAQQAGPESFIQVVQGLIEKRERIVIVYDLTHSKPDAHRRQLVVSWLRKNRANLSCYVIASAIVAPTAFHRGVLVAIFWFIKPRMPVQIFDDRDAAMRWATAQLQRMGLTGIPMKGG